MIMKTLPIQSGARKYFSFCLFFSELCILIDHFRMTIGWVEEYIRGGEVVDGYDGC